jgi:hypothetical protein
MKLVDKDNLLEDLFLENHKQGLFLQSNSDKRKTASDFTANTWFGSLYQRLIAELGGFDHIDRLAVVDSTLNNRKKYLWSMNNRKETGVEAAKLFRQLNQLIDLTSQEWCDTATGMINVLQSFCLRRSHASPNPATAADHPPLTINPKVNTRNPHPSGSGGPSGPPVTPANIPGRPQRGQGAKPNYGTPEYYAQFALSPVKSPANPSAENDETYDDNDTSAMRRPSGDMNRPPLRGDYQYQLDLNYDDLLVEFLKGEISTAASLMQSQFDAIEKTLTGADLASVKGFKVTFGARLEECPVIRDHEAREPEEGESTLPDSPTPAGPQGNGKGR